MWVGLCQEVQEKKKNITEVLKNKSHLLENCYSWIFGVADYRSSFGFKNFKMADPL